jgi:hypothetical protein
MGYKWSDLLQRTKSLAEGYVEVKMTLKDAVPHRLKM